MMAADVPSLRHLRMFETVARLESVSRAAVEVGRSQPAVTQALAKIERSLGVELIERRHAGSYLTASGQIFLLRNQRLFARVERALAEPLVGAPFVDHARLRPVMGRLSSNHVLCLVGMAPDRAAAALRTAVTTRTLLRSVREVERILDRRITRHGAHGTSLNPAGVELARQLHLALKEIEYAREEIAAARGVAQATISIGAMPQCATIVLTSAIEELMRRVPGAQVKVASGPYDLLLGELRSGKLDLLFGVLRKPDWATDVDEEALFEAPYAIIVRKQHPLARKRRLSLDDLAAYDWILPKHGTPRHLAFERMFAGRVHKPRSSIETNRSDLQVMLIAGSDRVTMMSAHEAGWLKDRGSVSVLDFCPSVERRCDGIATRTDWHPTAASRRFLDILRERSRSVGGSQERSTGRAHPALA